MPEPRIHTHTHTHTLRCTTSRDTVAAFSKAKMNRKKGGSSAVRFGKTHTRTHRAAADTHADERFELSHTARRCFSLPKSLGFRPSLVWPGRHSRGGRERQQTANHSPVCPMTRRPEPGRANQVSTTKHSASMDFQV